MTPRQRVLINGVLRSSISMPTFAIHSREYSPVAINVEALLAQMEVEDAEREAKRLQLIANQRAG